MGGLCHYANFIRPYVGYSGIVVRRCHCVTIIFPDDDETVYQARQTTNSGDILAAAIRKKYLLAHSFALKAVLLPYP